MKIGIFTDSHYSSKELTCGKRRNNLSLAKIQDAYELFKREKCELVISLGDLIDTDETHALEVMHLSEIARIIARYDIQTIALMGNHDAFAFEVDEFYNTLGIEKLQTLEKNGKQLLFLDACYFKSGKHYLPGDSDWTDTFLPSFDKIKRMIDNFNGESIVFIHQNIDPATPEDHRIYNYKEVFEYINSSRKVKHIFQGHFHSGITSHYGEVTYHTLPAVCENENAYYIYEI